MDSLSDVLSLLKIRSYMVRAVDTGGEWSVRFGPHHGIKLFAVISGEGRLAVHGVEGTVRAGAGDCLLLPSGCAFQAASDLALPPVDGEALLSGLTDGEIARWNGGGSCLAIIGHFELAEENAAMLLTMLPPIVHIREEQDKQVLRWCLERTMKELQEAQPGHTLIAQQLTLTMLVQVLRTFMAEEVPGRPGWLFALADEQIGRSLRAMHAAPGRQWKLTALAQEAGMSRTGFAVAFKRLVGVAPIEYLTRWRMMLARERLLTSAEGIAGIAEHVGYDSESAFSTAFKRVVGCSPRRYASQGKATKREPFVM
jgi:AraC-like DNA-binding protein